MVLALPFLLMAGLPAARAAALPPDMTGVWAFDPASCDDENSTARLSVAGARLDSRSSAFKLRDIKQRPDGSWGVRALRADERHRKRARDTLVLKLVSPDRLVIRDNHHSPRDYFRCKIAQRTT
jgi:hypothetical protein